MVSVIVAAYNAEKDLARCLESVLGQDFSEFEIIVCDDGSTDHTAQTIRDFCQKDSRVKGFSLDRRRGQADARNQAVMAAQGETLAFIDSDCVAEKNWLSLLVEPILKEKFAVSQGLNCLDLNHRFWSRLEAARISNYPGFDPKSAAITRELFFKLGKFEVERSPIEDVYFNHHLEKQGIALAHTLASARHNFYNNPLKNLKKYIGKGDKFYRYFHQCKRESWPKNLGELSKELIRRLVKSSGFSQDKQASFFFKLSVEIYRRIFEAAFLTKLLYLRFIASRTPSPEAKHG